MGDHRFGGGLRCGLDYASGDVPDVSQKQLGAVGPLSTRSAQRLVPKDKNGLFNQEEVSQKLMATTPTVSVVMSVLNGERFLCESVESILAQSFREFEFIIIDDGSTDRTASILDTYQRSDPRVRIHHQENRGLVESLNFGCGLARGKYIARMDADDVATTDRLTRQVAFMEEHPHIGLLGGAVEIVDVTGRYILTSRNPTEAGEIRFALLTGCPFWHPTVVIRQEVFAAVGGYRKVVVDAEDYDLWLRISERWGPANLELVVLKYRLHPWQVTVRKCRTMGASSLAARAAATARRKGDPDPLERVSEITPAVLSGMGVDAAAQEAAVAGRYLWAIRSMYHTRQYSAALDALVEMQSSSEWESAGARVAADLRFLAAQLYWRQGRLVRSILSAGQAIIMRPVMIARPLKPVLRWRGPLGRGCGVRK